MEVFEDFIPVPKEFWSFETGNPFQRCFMCDGDLCDEGCNYLIEKAVRNDEVIFEYAICWLCRIELEKEFSEQSLRLIENYFNEHVDIEQRRVECLEKFGTDYQKWIERCMIKHKPREECEEYQLYAWCVDRDLVFTGMPYMLSSECIDDIIELLSDETIGAINEFSDKVFGVDLPKDLLII